MPRTPAVVGCSVASDALTWSTRKGRRMSIHDDDGNLTSLQSTGQSRRGFLRNAALAGAGAAALSTVGSVPAFAAEPNKPGRTGTWTPNATSLQFTLAVMPDTQYLAWGSQDSINMEP